VRTSHHENFEYFGTSVAIQFMLTITLRSQYFWERDCSTKFM